MWWSLLLKPKWIITAGILVTLALGSFFLVRYIQKAEENKVTTKIQDQQIEKRKKIDEAIRNSPSNVDDSLRYLRGR